MALTHAPYEANMSLWLEMPDEEFVDTEAGWVTEYTKLGEDGAGTELDDWQVFNLNNPATFAIYVKSRQVGFSWVQALKKLARCALIPGYQGIFTSINQLESQEKLRYLNLAWETLPEGLRMGPLRKKVDNSLTVEFANGARVTSFPSKAPRGRAGADITMDEIAHVMNAKQIYDGTTAASVRKEDTTVELGSSPLNAGGFMYDVVYDPNNEYRAYDGQRWFIHWWDSSGLCTNVHAARRAAERERWDLHQDRDAVERRVERFGTARFKLEFYSKSIDAFLQEFECVFASDNAALIALQYIEACCDPGLEYLLNADEKSGNKPWIVTAATPSYVQEVMVPKIITLLHEAGKDRELTGAGEIYMGFDPARNRNQSVITIVQPCVDAHDKPRIRILGRIAFRDTPLHVQELLLDAVLHHPYVRKLTIDRSGIGIDLSDRLMSAYGEEVVEGINFSVQTKGALGSRMVLLYERGTPWHPHDRDLVNQLYALKRVTTKTGQESIQAPDTKHHHADAAWSLALALYYVPEGTLGAFPQAMTAGNLPREYYADRKSYINEVRDSYRTERALAEDHDYYSRAGASADRE